MDAVKKDIERIWVYLAVVCWFFGTCFVAIYFFWHGGFQTKRIILSYIKGEYIMPCDSEYLEPTWDVVEGSYGRRQKETFFQEQEKVEADI